MKVHKIESPGLACFCWILGDEGEAAIVDPPRDVDRILRLLAQERLDARYILVTHRQEDYLLGALDLSAATGAEIVALRHENLPCADVPILDGEHVEVGSLLVKALHVPGHTEESVCWAVSTTEQPDLCLGVFTGDALLPGATGRTDLADPDRAGENAGRLYDALHAKVLPLGDQALVWPAHGKGSVCGARIAPREPTTLGVERRTNPVFTLGRDAFVAVKAHEGRPRPPYFDRMRLENTDGGTPIERTLQAVTFVSPEELVERLGEGVLVDTRPPEAYAGAHVPLSLSLPLPILSIYGGWMLAEDAAVFLIVADDVDPREALRALARVGIDEVQGVLQGGISAWRDAGLPLERAGTTSPRELGGALTEGVVLDVREPWEREETGIVPGARTCFVGELDERLDEVIGDLDEDTPIVVTCSVGVRASLAVSMLLRHGFTDVSNLLGGMTAWTKLSFPVEHEGERASDDDEQDGEHGSEDGGASRVS